MHDLARIELTQLEEDILRFLRHADPVFAATSKVEHALGMEDERGRLRVLASLNALHKRRLVNRDVIAGRRYTLRYALNTRGGEKLRQIDQQTLPLGGAA